MSYYNGLSLKARILSRDAFLEWIDLTGLEYITCVDGGIDLGEKGQKMVTLIIRIGIFSNITVASDPFHGLC